MYNKKILEKDVEFGKFLDDMIREDKIHEPDPFFYTRLQGRLETEKEKNYQARRANPAIQAVFITTLFVASLTLGIYFGTGLSNQKQINNRQTELIQYASENDLTEIIIINEENLILE